MNPLNRNPPPNVSDKAVETGSTKPIDVGPNKTIIPNPIKLLNSRQTEVHQEDLPEPYSKLTTEDAKKE